jgi:hypothetical protein
MTEGCNSICGAPPGDSSPYEAGESAYESAGEAGELVPLERPRMLGEGRNWGEGDPPFCLVRFICKHRSG